MTYNDVTSNIVSEAAAVFFRMLQFCKTCSVYPRCRSPVVIDVCIYSLFEITWCKRMGTGDWH